MNKAFLPIELERSRFLVDAGLIEEVLGAEPWLPIPRARPELPGVVAWRGRAVPLVDLGRVLGLSDGTTRSRARTLIVDHARGVAAIPVDGASEVRSVAADKIREAHAVEFPYSSRELDDSGTVVAVIDLESLLSDLEGTGMELSHVGS